MDEDPKSRLSRELTELLNELKVALPGVQLLFAFLLAVPFTDRFASVTRLQRAVFFGTFLCTTASLVLLIAPSVYHRLHFRRHDKEQVLITSNRFAIVGQFLLAIAVIGVVYLITDLLYQGVLSALITVLVAVFFFAVWYALPLWRRQRADQ